MNARLARLTIFAGAALLLAGSAHAASFDCAKAAQPDEKAICRSRVLSELDVRMAALYGARMKVPMMMGSRGAAQDEQHAFLVERASCGANSACVGAAYQQRIDAINAELDAAMRDYCAKLGICG